MEQIKPDLERQVDKLREPFRAFVSAQTTASAFLVLAMGVALWLANSRFAADYQALQQFPLGLVYGETQVVWPLLHLVNDGVIALFFFLIGLEIKRELLVGELRDGARARLLLSAALGGMLVPAALYLAINAGMDGGHVHGWAIPMATDTAIAIGVLAALGSRIPRSVAAFLVGVAIVDDIGAILVIALVYTEGLNLTALVVAAVFLSFLILLNRAGFRTPALYATAGIGLWIAIVHSGIHASIAGVIVAAAVPARPRLRPAALGRRIGGIVAKVSAAVRPQAVLAEAHTHQRITQVERLARASTTPLRRWEAGLELPVALLVLPLFAFLNAGVRIDLDTVFGMFGNPVLLGTVAGLVVGKPVGILLGVWLGTRTGWAVPPPGLTTGRLAGIGLLAGVGFTMSTFIANLALGKGTDGLAGAKFAIVVASAISALAGYTVLRLVSERAANGTRRMAATTGVEGS